MLYFHSLQGAEALLVIASERNSMKCSCKKIGGYCGRWSSIVLNVNFKLLKLKFTKTKRMSDDHCNYIFFWLAKMSQRYYIQMPLSFKKFVTRVTLELNRVYIRNYLPPYQNRYSIQ
uniref:Uncharacterized protein n=1 Tax=Rhizophagus irregularis (strain DAOM 181602 / DAOM 197198 / MUCL 43194) TaxID=747089 RepID=U9T8U2_RHIID